MSRQLVSPANLVAFEDRAIRRKWHNEEWYFSIIDVIAVLSESSNPRRYWSDLKSQLIEKEELYEKIVQLKLLAPDGKLRETDGANTQTMLRIIQSVPSPQADPLIFPTLPGMRRVVCDMSVYIRAVRFFIKNTHASRKIIFLLIIAGLRLAPSF